jgi:polyisoprenoid-binding protein YceI
VSFFLLSNLSAQEAEVHVSLSPAGSFVGKTDDVRGEIEIMGDGYKAENISVGLKNLKTGIQLRDKHTQDYLETSKHPEATLIHAEGKKGKGTGEIKIRGIVQKVEGTYTIEGNLLRAEFPIFLEKFNIKGIRYAGVGVKDKALIKVSVPLRKPSK